MSEQTRFRCAIYTRKSSEEGLDQDFNSLEAQREACEAYIRSQAHEGWKLIPDRFDDGGFSGGNMERPALAQLMEQLRDDKIDIIVIYKIDRLTRSLTDFARLAETFDKHNVSFVSVTQQFNTTTSLGRLMLNVLLSFAQFEREITGERIRDKIAASKKKGMWMGGVIPMGYNVRDRQLVINEVEAATIRKVFALYLEVGSVPALLDRLGADNILTAPRLSASARKRGNRNFTRGHLYKLLSNPIYIGRVPHKKVSYPGRHESIVDTKTWAATQAQLQSNTQGTRDRRRRALAETHLLAGLLRSENGTRFIPTHANKGSRRYRYYVEDVGAGKTPRRLAANQIETATLAALRAYLADQQQLVSDLGDVAADQVASALQQAQQNFEQLGQRPDQAQHTTLRSVVTSVRYRDTQLELEISQAGLRQLLQIRRSVSQEWPSNAAPDGDFVTYRTPIVMKRRGPQMKMVVAGQDNAVPDDRLITAIVRARRWAERLTDGSTTSLTELAAEEKFTPAYISRTLPLAYLAPQIVEGILRGKFSSEILNRRGVQPIIDISWQRQLDMLRPS
ncbi:recombinase family protein [Devosia ginsengisoli]|uniref:recombinase family protein n=1 Tax=Devosia ginsengisoli TaxID=400770 RepID=UPI0026F098B7|nr:recombinase family protein [Devosia ginsengisoli]MCR6670742.1 recombinase family protein [Devosia ginsengisoli]